MKNTRVWITLTAGLASGLLAGYLALVYVSEEPAPLQANNPEGTQIVVAGRDLPSGTILTREDVEIIAWPSRNTPEGFASQPGEVIGRGVIGKVHRNEPLLMAKLASQGSGRRAANHHSAGVPSRQRRSGRGHRGCRFRPPGDSRRRARHGDARDEPLGDHHSDDPPEDSGPHCRPILSDRSRRRPGPGHCGDPSREARGGRGADAGFHRGADSAGTSEHAGRGFSEHVRNADQLPGPRPPETCPPGPLHNAGQTSRGCGGGRPTRAGTRTLVKFNKKGR